MSKYKRIGIFIGHSILKNGDCTSASGIKNEYQYNKILGADLKDVFENEGQASDVIIVPEYRYNAGYEDDYKLPIANSGKYDFIIELHLNCYNGNANGAEVICYPNGESKDVALRVQSKFSTKFRDRGIVKTTEFYMIRETKPPAIMVEPFFCDSATDCKIADSLGTKGLAKLIAEGVLNKEIVLKEEGFEKGSFHKNVRITAEPSLRVRTGRGTNHPQVVNHSDGRAISFPKGQIVEVWYIDKDADGDLWGSCSSGAKDANGNSITGFISMGYTERV